MFKPQLWVLLFEPNLAVAAAAPLNLRCECSRMGRIQHRAQCFRQTHTRALKALVNRACRHTATGQMPDRKSRKGVRECLADRRAAGARGVAVSLNAALSVRNLAH